MQAVLFDLDGTLLDLPVDIEPARQRIAAIFRARGWHGEMRPILRAIAEAATSVAGDPAERDRLEGEARAFIDEVEVRAAARAIARDGAAQVLAALSDRGLPLGIITDNGRACLAPALAHTGLDQLTWRVQVTRDEAGAAKPAPAGVERAAAALLPDGGELWLVGDSPRDMQAARAASVPGVLVHPVGVLGGRGDRASLEAAGAGAVVGGLRELPTMLG